MAASQVLVELGVVPSVQLIDGQLPDGVAPCGAVTSIAVALVRHSERKYNHLIAFIRVRISLVLKRPVSHKNYVVMVAYNTSSL